MITTRQQEIIRLSAEGLKNEAIAEKLGISINTVKYHKKEIFKKLHVKSMIEVVKIAYDEKIVSSYPKG